MSTDLFAVVPVLVIQRTVIQAIIAQRLAVKLPATLVPFAAFPAGACGATASQRRHIFLLAPACTCARGLFAYTRK